MKHTVLLVEDEEDLRELLRFALEASGFSVVAAQEGQEALDAFARIEHVCVVLLDLLMPGMNGWEFFEQMRARPELDHVPVIVHSSMPNQAPVGATRVLRKPLDVRTLVSVVREFCPD